MSRSDQNSKKRSIKLNLDNLSIKQNSPDPDLVFHLDHSTYHTTKISFKRLLNIVNSQTNKYYTLDNMDPITHNEYLIQKKKKWID